MCRHALWISFAVSVHAATPAPTPEAALKQMRVAPGFSVTLAAAEPHIRQPLSVSFDSRGRMWVLQYLQYPNPAGLKPVSIDQYLRTKYDRVPEPPPRGDRGADRITICEDKNGDGVADTFRDFVAGLNLASGFAFGPNGVFVVQPPYLLFYADKNHDDIPDGDPEVLLTGFGLEDSHAVANSLTLGPDGWLYGAQGSTVTANIRGIEFQQGIWRYHPVTREFELYAEGGGNTWGLDFDEEGEAIVGTNFGEVIGLHQVQGGYYIKGFAKHGPLHNPHTYGYLDHFRYSGWKGGRVICGGVIYQGGALGPQIADSYIAANLLRRSVDWHYMEQDGSTVRSQFGGAFIETEDVTFRPVDCTAGPDGAIYVSDWCDERASHVDPVDNWDKDTGRIYRIAREGMAQRGAVPSDLRKLSTDALLNLLTNGNAWFRREARMLLAERSDAAIHERLRAGVLQTENNLLSLESLWALAGCGRFDETFGLKLLSHPHAPVRAWAVRLIGDTRGASDAAARELATMARGETSPRVRRQLACSARRWPAAVAMPIVRELLRHEPDVKDSHIPLVAWWAIEDKAISNSREVLSLLSDRNDWSAPLMQAHILERLARRYASETNASHRDTCAWLLTNAPSAMGRAAVLRGMDAAWQGMVINPGARLVQAVARTWKVGELLSLRVGLRVGLAEAQRQAISRLTNRTVADSERLALAEVLGQCRVVPAIPGLIALLGGKAKLQTAAISALQNFAEDGVGAALIDSYAKLGADARIRARSALVSRPGWAVQLLQAVDAGRIDSKSLTPDQLQQIVRHNDAALTAAVEKRWGRMQPQTSIEKQSSINTLKLVLNPSGTTHRFVGDAKQGKVLYDQLCGTCHKLFGEGKEIGPDITGSERRNTDWLLGQVVDPSAFIRPEYVNHNIEMKDGRSFTGLLADQNDSSVTVLDAQNQRTVLSRAEIQELAPSATSLMPEGLLEPLQHQQVRDLFKYLQTEPAQ